MAEINANRLYVAQERRIGSPIGVFGVNKDSGDLEFYSPPQDKKTGTIYNGDTYPKKTCVVQYRSPAEAPEGANITKKSETERIGGKDYEFIFWERPCSKEEQTTAETTGNNFSQEQDLPWEIPTDTEIKAAQNIFCRQNPSDENCK